MPLITIESGNLTTKQKAELIEKLTAVASEITKIPSEFFLVTIKELSDSNIGIGGKTIDKIKAGYKK
ncbi:MAG: 4-oxalocrotonate tautomerase [Firmicutes bacterium]|nr:4-oxalocrotonate tautomerase [Bacillota bacterium]